MDSPKVESPKTPYSQEPSPKKSDTPSRKGVPVLRLLSGRVKDSSMSKSLHLSQELKINSADSDEERTVCFISLNDFFLPIVPRLAMIVAYTCRCSMKLWGKEMLEGGALVNP